ncbi:MAG: 2,3-bisphosphoglycerate-independent phosphoglycerate mutase [Campylobacteraceae bacterium]|jgi:2,3-bisphosphoglycerate-independent phosphoglycerate mutase|nr:2,3-bisphosphoglycerate-independent phosphoglycerate mutase [Campylobacteraceae bacterium]
MKLVKFNKTILIITDGIGYNKQSRFNAFNAAKKPTYDMLFEKVPYTLLKTSALAVGLPEGQMGNSEVGHMCIGSGRILYQNLVKISMAIENGTLAKNGVLADFFSKSGDIHIIGLVSDGGVHSHIEHIKALAKIAANAGKKVFLHAITDGRDVSPVSAADFLQDLLDICDDNISLAAISGRFWAMDRDERWERVQRAYDTFVKADDKTKLGALEYIKYMYDKGVTDEFLEPAAFDGFDGIKEGDGVLFANFRNDRMRQIVKAFGMEEFGHFKRELKSVNIVTMCEYDKTFTYPVLFTSQKPSQTLCEVISQNGISQFHTAETEKYAHVTFFFNGGKESPVEGETRVLIPSPKVKTYDLKPEMSAAKVGDTVLKAMDANYGFIVVNFANGDMVGHTGNYEAAVKAVEAVDKELGRIYRKARDLGYKFVLTSDHGNCEAMRDEGGILTNHTTFDVFCFVAADEVTHLKSGGLSNVAATVLKLMGIKKPDVMQDALF